MDDLTRQAFTIQEPPEQHPVTARSGPMSIIQMLSPAQRLFLSIFLFMDVCLLCAAFLYLFGKIVL